LKFGGGNLFSPAMTSTIEGNNSVGSLQATVEEGDPRSGLKNVMYTADIFVSQSGFFFFFFETNERGLPLQRK
jgi:hypothetical protein